MFVGPSVVTPSTQFVAVYAITPPSECVPVEPRGHLLVADQEVGTVQGLRAVDGGEDDERPRHQRQSLHRLLLAEVRFAVAARALARELQVPSPRQHRPAMLGGPVVGERLVVTLLLPCTFRPALPFELVLARIAGALVAVE